MQQNDDAQNEPQEVSLTQPTAGPEVNTQPTSGDVSAEPQPTDTTTEDEPEVIVDETVYRANAKEADNLPIRTERKSAAVVDIINTISLLYTTVQNAGATLSQFKTDSMPNPAGALRWLQAVQNAEQYSPTVDALGVSQTAWRDGAVWRQFVEHEGKRLRVGVPKLDTAMTGGLLSGDAAIRRIQQRMSLGTHLQWPLWNSGIWVTFVPPMEEAILELQERINQEKIALGRQTNGAVFDNYQVYIVDHVLRFAMQHISAMTLKAGTEGTEAALEAHMLVSDIPNLMMGVLCSIYPNGYDLTQPCTADISKCTAVHTATVSLSKMAWVDQSRLNDSQRRLMARLKSDSVTSEEVLKYQSEFAAFKNAVADLRDGISVVFQVPTVATYRDSGRRWVDGIESDTQQVFGTTLVGREREEYMFQQAVLSTLQAYSHWYKHIVIRGTGEEDDQIIEDRDTLERLAKTLSADENVVRTIDAAVRAFNDEATCTTIGITNYSCPDCGKTQLRPDAPNQVLIPIDVVGTFFTLLSRRLARILQA